MTMAQKKTAQKKVQKRSFILTLGLVLLIGYFLITIVDLQLQTREANAELEQKEAEYEQVLAENERLEAILINEDKSEYMEQIAREKLGFVMPGEKVFYDVTPGA